MENENTQVQSNEQPKQPQGWKDVQLNGQMPLDALVGFLNVLNQRLVNVEDTIKLDVNGTQMSLTAIYAEEAKKQQEEMAKQAAEKAKADAEQPVQPEVVKGE